MERSFCAAMGNLMNDSLLLVVAIDARLLFFV